MPTLSSARSALAGERLRTRLEDFSYNGARFFDPAALAEKLTLVARRIAGGCPTRIVLCGDTQSGALLLTALLDLGLESNFSCVAPGFEQIGAMQKHLPSDLARVAFVKAAPEAVAPEILWRADDRLVLFSARFPENWLRRLPAGHELIVPDFFFIHAQLLADSPQQALGLKCSGPGIPAEPRRCRLFDCGAARTLVCPEGAEALGRAAVEGKITPEPIEGTDAAVLKIPAGTELGDPGDAGTSRIIEVSPLATLLKPENTAAPLRTELEEAVRLYNESRYPEALDRLQPLAVQNPHLPGLNLALASCAIKLGLPEAAEKLVSLDAENQQSPTRSHALRWLREIRRWTQERTAFAARPLPSFTFFTSPKPFTGIFDAIQRRAIESWLRAAPGNEVLLFGDDEGCAQVSREYGLRHIPAVKANEFGTPLIDDLFAQAQSLAKNEILVYVNADIILLEDFSRALDRVSTHFGEFLVIGQRRDVELPEDFSLTHEQWQTELKKEVVTRGGLHSVCGIDYYAFTPGLWDRIEPFALGRCAWDNWLVYEAIREGKPVIDATRTICAVHQNHDYSHCKTSRDNSYRGVQLSVEAQRNRQMLGGNGALGYTSCAPWVINPDGFKRRTKNGEF